MGQDKKSRRRSQELRLAGKMGSDNTLVRAYIGAKTFRDRSPRPGKNRLGRFRQPRPWPL